MLHSNTCHACSRSIEFAVEQIGHGTKCPDCGVPVVLTRLTTTIPPEASVPPGQRRHRETDRRGSCAKWLLAAYFGSFAVLAILAAGFKIAWAERMLSGWLVILAGFWLFCWVALGVLGGWEWIAGNPKLACVSIGRAVLVAGITCMVVGLIQDADQDSIGWVQATGWIASPIGFFVFAIGSEMKVAKDRVSRR